MIFKQNFRSGDALCVTSASPVMQSASPISHSASPGRPNVGSLSIEDAWSQ